MSIFNDFFKKESPILSLLGMGGGGTGITLGGAGGDGEFFYLVIAGGGGGGRGRGGGGGAGGYRTNFTGESPGGPGTVKEDAFTIALSTNYPVQVGHGGVAGPAADKRGFQGGPSIFSTVTSTGGAGGGAAYQPISRLTEPAAYEGGSGGGGAGQVTAPHTNKGKGSNAVSPSSSPPQPVQGFRGGDSPDNSQNGAGGGGAGAVGFDVSPSVGGAGKASSITGSSVTRGGGGGGGGDTAAGAGGAGGGGAGSTSTATNASANLGAGGGGSIYHSGAGRGGTGVVILRYVNTMTIANPGGGLTLSTATDGGFKVTTITHPGFSLVANAAGNVSFS